MDREAILDEVIEYNAPAKLRSDEFTVHQYMERREEQGSASISPNTAIRYLNRLVERGVLTMRKVLVRGYWQNAYSISSEEHGREEA
jgi:Fic family protein